MKFLNCILTLGCLSGLVSCYPVAANQHGSNTQNKKISANSPAADAQQQVDATKKKVAYTDVTTPDYGAPTVGGVAGAVGAGAGAIAGLGDDLPNVGSVTDAPVVKDKPVVPLTVKTAKKVPGREGFVFNPYTHNQVDVRGIPSGTKVRDPHDSNPAHVFRVP